MRSTNTSKLLLALGLILIIFLGWGLYSSIEFYDETEHSAWSLNALRNPYLAAQQFMQETGLKAMEADSLIGLNSLDGVETVLITDANQVVNPRQLDQVISWLESGGTLIVTANSVARAEDLLLKEFNVEVNWPDLDDESDDGESEDKEVSISETMREFNQQIEDGKSVEEISRSPVKDESLTSIDFGEDIGVLEIGFSWDRVLTHPYIEGSQEDGAGTQPFSWSSSEYGIHMMQFDVGKGLLTIISDPTIWTSRRIDQHDHAYLLWVLSSKNGDFAVLHPSLRDSIWVLIKRNAPELLIALAFLIAFWLWHKSRRFGRIVPRDTSAGRALGAHFSATANYLWHRKAGDALIEPVRQQIFRRASIVLPGFITANNDPERQLELISKHCGIEKATVDMALNTREFNETSFVRTVKLLKYIEQSL
ncbi:MAG: DUF4350 domain-containing protein [Gammaproteobacteria bacterium]